MKFKTYILTFLLMLCVLDVSAQSADYGVEIFGVGVEAFENASAPDVSKALYGKIAGLNVYQGSGSSADNISKLSVHGRTPLVLVDGFERDLSDLTSCEIESVRLLTDAASAALYGVRGANGVLLVTTRRGNSSSLEVSARYAYGLSTQFRAPDFADALTYAHAVNAALEGDGNAPRYSSYELDAIGKGLYPNEYPDVDWWRETLNDTGHTHSLKLTFDGGGNRFRYFVVADYYRDRSMFKENTTDPRYSTRPTDTRLSVRANLDVEVTATTFLKAGLSVGLKEFNGTAYGRKNMMDVIYSTPSAAFPIKTSEGIYGGNAVYGEKNPVALLVDKGHIRNMYGSLLADMTLSQSLDAITEGLDAEVRVAFDNIGGMNETTSKTYRYMDTAPQILPGGTLVTTPVYFGTDSRTLTHTQPFESLVMRTSFQAKVSYERSFGRNTVTAAAMYDLYSAVIDGRNNSRRNQSFIINAGWSFADRYMIDAVVSHSGSSYLPDGSRYHTYPAVSAAWVISNENFLRRAGWLDLLRIRASYGISGWDGNLSHELWRQSYGSGGSWYFGTNATPVAGGAEGRFPVAGLVPEKVGRMTVGVDFSAFDGRLSMSLDAFREKRTDVLVSGSSSTSGIIGIDVGQTCEGEYLYKGIDGGVRWKGKAGDFEYGAGVSGAYLMTEVLNENQAYQEYDYLYHKGNRLGQCYGLEAIGFFSSQLEINNSPRQMFSAVRPGDVKYKDQNADNVIDSKDVVRMFGSTIPRFYFGFDLRLAYRGFELLADFQGITGVTVSLLDSPLYNPLADNGNISQTYLDNEVPWTHEDMNRATMPRLSTESSENNRQPGSLWYRDGSFIKLRNLVFSYTFPKTMLRFAQMKVFVQGTNLFSLDNIGFTDPEQLQAAYPSVRTFWAGVKFNF